MSSLLILACLSTALSYRVLDRLIPLQAQSLGCPVYKCATAKEPMVDGTCIAPVTSNTTIVQPCLDPALPYCSPVPAPAQNVTCSAVPAAFMYPGESCTENAGCVSGLCTDLVCEGKGESQVCRLSLECNPGLTCRFGTCQPQIAEGDTGCLIDTDCVNTCTCVNVNKIKTCVRYFSVPSNQAVSDCTNVDGISLICQSGYCDKAGFFSAKGTCMDPPVTQGTLPLACSSNTDCLGKNSVESFVGLCQCGFNEEGASYCTLFEGDPAGLAFFDMIKQVIDSQAFTKCNTSRRFSLDCWKQVDDDIYEDLLLTYYNFANYAQLVGHKQCIDEVFFPGMFESGAYAIAAVAGLLVFSQDLRKMAALSQE